MTLLEQIKEFFGCVSRGGHSFPSETGKCLRCGAPKGGESLLDMFARMPGRIEPLTLCRTCWEKHSDTIEHCFSIPGPECALCGSKQDLSVALRKRLL